MCKTVIAKLEGKRRRARSRRGKEDNIRMDREKQGRK
jgi:hypothetical protein